MLIGYARVYAVARIGRIDEVMSFRWPVKEVKRHAENTPPAPSPTNLLDRCDELLARLLSDRWAAPAGHGGPRPGILAVDRLQPDGGHEIL